MPQQQPHARTASIADVIDSLCNHDNMRHVCPERRSEGVPLLSNKSVSRIVRLASGLLFPGFYDDEVEPSYVLRSRMTIDCHELRSLLSRQAIAAICFSDPDCLYSLDQIEKRAVEAADSFISSLPSIRTILDTDVDATYLGDPAATSTREVIVCYPGFRAVMSHRIAHRLIELDVPILPRMISEQAHSVTGIDIHPGATIGKAFVIDHGTGVVIGATACIGDNVKIYQGVTLGARSFERDENGNPLKGVPRHPVVGNDVVIYSNSTLLGRITVGDGAVIGGNLWVTRDVAPGERLVQAAAENFRSSFTKK